MKGSQAVLEVTSSSHDEQASKTKAASDASIGFQLWMHCMMRFADYKYTQISSTGAYSRPCSRHVIKAYSTIGAA